MKFVFIVWIDGSLNANWNYYSFKKADRNLHLTEKNMSRT